MRPRYGTLTMATTSEADLAAAAKALQDEVACPVLSSSSLTSSNRVAWNVTELKKTHVNVASEGYM